jgi:Pyruvate/2-oxoacid:ferredoxin oxidoreductase delta subunit
MGYSRLIIYYFSGTGNAKNAAQWIIDKAKEKGLKTQLINIDRFESIENPELSEKTIVGFCSPTHGFNLPPIMLKFIVKFPKIQNADAFILNTRAGMKLNKLFLPGLSGLAQIFPAIILRLKGFKIVGMQPLDLPSNWILLHPGLKEEVIYSIYSRCNKIVNNFTEKILYGKRKYKALLSLPIDIAIAPIAIAYYFVGRFFIAKTLIATDDCDSCKLCVKKCPVESIIMVNNRPFWRYNCESCMRCVNICPKRAIETAHSFSGLLIFIYAAIFTPIILKGIEAAGLFDWFKQSILTENLLSLLKAFIFIWIMILSYGLLHFLMRYKFFARFIAYTSLSNYKFWRRYKAPKNFTLY